MKSLASLGYQVPDFTLCAAQKLQHLQATGYHINGVSIELRTDDGSVTHGALTTWGRVLWWHPAQRVAVPPPSAGALLRRAAIELQAQRDALLLAYTSEPQDSAQRGEVAKTAERLGVLIADIRRATAPEARETAGCPPC